MSNHTIWIMSALLILPIAGAGLAGAAEPVAEPAPEPGVDDALLGGSDEFLSLYQEMGAGVGTCATARCLTGSSCSVCCGAGYAAECQCSLIGECRCDCRYVGGGANLADVTISFKQSDRLR